MTPQPTRSMAPFQWYGGKGNLLPFVLPHVTGGQVYVEPYCGAASVFFAKKQHPVEVLNDLNGELVNLFRVLQGERFEELAHRIRWTLYSRQEFCTALEVTPDADEVERAWAFFVRHNQGYSGKIGAAGNWSRTFIGLAGCALNTHRWRLRQSLLEQWRQRLMQVQIDNRDALEVIRYWDTPDTLFYVDPPYVLDTRKGGKAYDVEQCDEHHNELVATLLECQGRVVLSGYESPLYAPLTEAGWECLKRETHSYTGGKNRSDSGNHDSRRTECLWINRPDKQRRLF